MSYLTQAEAKQYLGDVYESAYYDDITQLPDDTVLQQDIDTVNGVINAYVKKAYNFEIVGVESLNILRGIAQRLLLSRAYERYDSAEIPEIVTTNADESTYRLKEISTGKMLLPDSVQAPKGVGFSYSMRGRSTIFDRSSMSGF